MKYFLAFFVLMFTVNAYAQDIIVTTKGETIKCVIKAESDSEVSYVNWKDKTGKLNTLPMSSVWSIAKDEAIDRVDVLVKAGVLSSSFPSMTSTSPNVNAASMSGHKTKNPLRKKYAWSAVGCYLGGFALYGGFLTLGLTTDMLGLGLGCAIGSLLAGSIGGASYISKMLNTPKYASVDFPLGDKFTLGVYNYAFTPTHSNGAGVGFKVNF